jgi:uncharacterized protein YbbC (DUF1343 family)
LITAYQNSTNKEAFFTNASFFDKLAGTSTLRQQIIEGVPEAAIRQTWQPAISDFKNIRKKYLLYPDFE